ncbi:MAG: hypothetical protein GF313_05465 [Caldithrix sp.]|nr:hypothetical protein [Caldithrix sp.]
MADKKENQHMCPIFPDMPCPRGKDGSDQCQVRMATGYDPMTDLKDYAMMHCALLRSRQKNDEGGTTPLV